MTGGARVGIMESDMWTRCAGCQEVLTILPRGADQVLMLDDVLTSV